MRDIGGRVAIVTGASRGLGAAIARSLFDHGMKVVLAARSDEDLESVRSEFDRTGARTLTVAVDVTKELSRDALLEATRKAFGGIDVLVNNAGTDHPENYVDADFDRVERMVALNLLAPMRLTQMVLPEMLRQGRGHIVNIGSMAGLAPVPYAVAYSATKHGLVGFSESLRYELKGTGVGVSVVCPHFVSEAGLFDRNSGGDTGGAATVTPGRVGEDVVKAIIHDRARVLSAPAMVLATPLVRALSPGLLHRISKVEGSHDAMKAMADRLKDDEPAPSGNGAAPAAAKPKRSRAGSA